MVLCREQRLDDIRLLDHTILNIQTKINLNDIQRPPLLGKTKGDSAMVVQLLVNILDKRNNELGERRTVIHVLLKIQLVQNYLIKITENCKCAASILLFVRANPALALS